VAGSPRLLELRVGDVRDALDRFEAAWNRRTEGRMATPLRVTPARWELLHRLRQQGAMSIYQLAKRLERDYKNVHTDVTALAKIGLIERAGDARVSVPWEVVRAEF